VSQHIILLTTLTALWVAFEIWLMIRDRAQGKGKTAKDRGTRYYNFIAIAVGLPNYRWILERKDNFLLSLGKKRCSFLDRIGSHAAFASIAYMGYSDPGFILSNNSRDTSRSESRSERPL